PSANLTQRFVEDDADGGSEVETADFAGRHRNRQDPIGMTLEQAGRQTFGLAAEKQAVPVVKRGARVGCGGMGAQAVHALRWNGGLEFFQRGMPHEIDMPPIVEAGTPQRTIIEAEAE